MIVKAKESDYPEIIDLWERSVSATHYFLPEEYLQEIKVLLPSILPAVELFIYIARKDIAGFAGFAKNKMEMLFVHPLYRGKGIGKALTQFAINECHITCVDVNEQNEQAVGFYKKLGFVVVNRNETDGLGRPFPILQMRLP